MSCTTVTETKTQVRLHVQLTSPPDGFGMTGSTSALGMWKPEAGLALEWNGDAWVARHPLVVAPEESLEFKFVQATSEGMVWEDGPNRALDIPNVDRDFKLSGKFNADMRLSIVSASDRQVEQSKADQDRAAAEQAAAAAWKRRIEDLGGQIAAFEEDLRAKRERHALALERREACAERLRRELAEVKREAAERRAARAEEALARRRSAVALQAASAAAAAVPSQVAVQEGSPNTLQADPVSNTSDGAPPAMSALPPSMGLSGQAALPPPSAGACGSATQRCPSAKSVPLPRSSSLLNVSGAGAGPCLVARSTSLSNLGAVDAGSSAIPRSSSLINLSRVGAGLSSKKHSTLIPPQGTSTTRSGRSAAPRPTVPVPQVELQAAAAEALALQTNRSMASGGRSGAAHAPRSRGPPRLSAPRMTVPIPAS
mmetsp:Transcript_136783/g.354769  ORF Transcript_136783/g.354769 Transcript_136783/m.354769 type:complete len:428 (-) Transcript_136783:660-1943(-)